MIPVSEITLFILIAPFSLVVLLMFIEELYSAFQERAWGNFLLVFTFGWLAFGLFAISLFL
jgi:hypothetical protein